MNVIWLSCLSYLNDIKLYNGGQKRWDLSSDISKTSYPSPPTPNKNEFWAKWLEMSAFLDTALLGGGGGVGERQHEPKADQKIVFSSRVLRKNYMAKGFFTQFQVLLSSIVRAVL